MPYLIIFAVGLWFLIGDPPKSIANAFWESAAAPWETVDAYYYPNRSDLSVFQSISGLSSVDDCRVWVRMTAAVNDDIGVVRGDYEYAIQVIDTFAGINVYRTTVR